MFIGRFIRENTPRVRPMSKRRARLNEQLRRELSELIRLQVRDPRVGLVTITGVDIAGDLGSARVYVRVVGGADEMAVSLQGLGAAAPFLRTQLGRILHLRRIPELRFQEDRSYEGAARIEHVLTEVFPETDEASPGGDVVAGAETEAPDEDGTTDGDEALGVRS